MKFILRVLGTWLLGLSLILVIIDGTKTLAARVLTTTSLSETWSSFHAASWESVRQAIMEFVAPVSGQVYAQYFLDWPGWIVFGILGFILLLIGRQRIGRSYIETN